MADLTPLQALALDAMACPYCGAQPGHWCRTVTGYTRAPGQRASYLHEPRQALLRAAWRIGVTDGEVMEQRRAAWQLERASRGA